MALVMTGFRNYPGPDGQPKVRESDPAGKQKRQSRAPRPVIQGNRMPSSHRFRMDDPDGGMRALPGAYKRREHEPIHLALSGKPNPPGKSVSHPAFRRCRDHRPVVHFSTGIPSIILGFPAGKSAGKRCAKSFDIPPPGWLTMRASRVVGYSSGQRGQTVNLLAYAYTGSNPVPTTTSSPPRPPPPTSRPMASPATIGP